VRVIRNFLVFLGVVILILSYSAQFSQLLSYPSTAKDMVAFTILMIALMLVPLFSLYSEVEKRNRWVKIILGGGGVALSVIELIPQLRELVGLMIPEHPFTVIPVFSLFLVCIGCAAGEIGVFISHPFYVSRCGLVKYVVAIAVAIVLAYVTWTSTHAAITVLI
jgi:hypothetical protein